MISIIDYGAGNLQSVEKALRHIGCNCQVTADPAALLASEAAVLPGVGSFGDAMDSSGPGLGGAHPRFCGLWQALFGHLLGSADPL